MFGIAMNSKTALQKCVPMIVERSFFGKTTACAIGRLSERENTRNASVYETAKKYRADNGGPPYGRMIASWNCNLHVRTADVWARDRALFSSSAWFRGGDDSTAAPPCEKEEQRGRERAADERDEEWPASSSGIGSSLQHMWNTSARESLDSPITDINTASPPGQDSRTGYAAATRSNRSRRRPRDLTSCVLADTV